VDPSSVSSEKPQNNVEAIIEGAKNSPIGEIYEFGNELGRGGFSIVLEATNKKDGEQYAIKVIEKKMVDEFEQLKREIDIMKKVNHKNILKLYDIYEDEHHVYIVMELVQGSELFDRIVSKGYYTEREAVNIIRQILEAVKYLHSVEIAHRDLKPENLLCSGENENEIVKIADFGLSKMFSADQKLATGCGTPGYVAPEVLLSDTYDCKVDLWSIGVITYILLSGYSPFYAENETGLFEKIMTAEYDFDNECWDDISNNAKNFIKKLLTKDPQKRLDVDGALEHPWLTESAPDKELNIGDKLIEYNNQRKEKMKAFNADESVDALNKAKSKLNLSQ